MRPMQRIRNHKWLGIVAVILFAAVLLVPAVPLRGAETGQAGGKAAQGGKEEGGKDGFLAAKHKSMGIECASCHKGTPPKPPEMTVCLGCHGPYDKLAARGEKLEPNPHMSHLGELECDNCHHGHKPSTDYCARCHTFGLKVP